MTQARSLLRERAVYVVGIGLHPYAFPSERPYVQLGLHAVREALGDAGIAYRALDATSPPPESVRARSLAELVEGSEVVVVAVPVVVVLLTLVTKKSSVPTLSTAFWLLSVAMRGLDSTCTLPWVSRNCISAAKLLVWKARPNNPPMTEGSVIRSLPGDEDSEEPVKVLAT